MLIITFSPKKRNKFKTNEKYRKNYPIIAKEKIAQISDTVFEVESQVKHFFSSGANS